WTGIFYRYFIHDPQAFKHAAFFAHLMDFILLYVLSGVILAYIKSIYSRLFGMKKTSKHVVFDRFTKFSLWLIFPLRLLSESFTATLYNNGGFLTQGLGDMINYTVADVLEIPAWTLYSFALGTFFVAMPFSRYMHIFTEVILIFLRKWGLSENEQVSGFTMYELSACSRCGICIDNCPLYKDLQLQGVQSIYFLRDLRYKRPKEEIADNCLMCNRCMAECPVGLDLMTIRRQMRNKKELDTESNYKYIDNLQAFNSIGRVVYFAGCMSHLTPGIVDAMLNIFDKVNQKYWFMDKDKTICCGRPLWQQGFSIQASELRRKNTQLIKQSGANMLVTSCPICYQSFKKEYNLPIQVMHHTEYIHGLIKSGQLKVRKDDLKVVYHDPCELGRGCGIYQAPRQILKSITTLLKTKNEKDKSLCCGYNLGNTVISLEQQTKIRNAAMDSLLSKHPDLIVTACPMCKKAFKRATDCNVKDIAELVKENMIL
ncbi:MAG: (Fe-S)-binding protein, partial [Bacteroidales bacterium]|nr:(Fe-S)-binding protein [Bacteroidales bacterium]